MWMAVRVKRLTHPHPLLLQEVLLEIKNTIFPLTSWDWPIFESESVSFSVLTLCEPTDCSLPAFSVHGILQARILGWVAIPFSRGSSRPRDQSLASCIGSQVLRCLSHQESPGNTWPIFQFSSVTQSCPTLCHPMDCSMPRFPVHHQLPEFTQTHVHRVGDAIQPSHPLSSRSPPALNLSQHQGLFKWVSSLHQVVKVLEFQFQHQSFQWTLRTDLL